MSTDTLAWQPLGKQLVYGPLALRKSQQVKLCRLDARKEINGMTGVVVSYNEEKMRYGIHLANGQSVLLRPECVEVLYERVDGSFSPCGDPAAHFLTLPLSTEDALRWEDRTQILSNHRATEVFDACPRSDEFNRRDLQVKPSNIPGAGRGVFAPLAHGLKKGDIVTQFAGAFRPVDSIGSQAYSQRTSKGMIEGASEDCCVETGVAQLINDGSCIADVESDTSNMPDETIAYLEASGAKRNVAMAVVGEVVVAVALRDIAPDEELFHSYGIAFWLGRLQRASLLMHDLHKCRTIDERFCKYRDVETSKLDSANRAVEWVSTPALTIRNGELLDTRDTSNPRPAHAQSCRQLCWARLGVESFTLSPPGRPPMECHVAAACALIMDVSPTSIPQWCLDNT